MLDWEALHMEIVGEAEDGEMALELVQELLPDLLFIDICIPIMTGLEVAEKVSRMYPNCIMILITGHDEFTFAQQALKLNVFDYLLKPVNQEDLGAVVRRAKKQLDQFSLQSKYMNWANNHLKKNFTSIRDRFLNEWINGQLSEIEVEEQLNFFEIDLSNQVGILMIKVTDRLSIAQGYREWNRQLLLFAVQNVTEESVQAGNQAFLFRDANDYLIGILPINNSVQFEELAQQVIKDIDHYLKCVVHVVQQRVKGSLLDVPSIYQELLQEIMREEHWSPIVALSKKFIDSHYQIETFSLQVLAEQFQISPAYLSRLLRQELGASFIDYLTRVRINRAIQLMSDPACKMYEVAEKVGYSTQHYFSTAFKKIMGVSPTEYRKGGVS
ncbi:helix-turn-helix domain-containing protein [Paenibacillus sp. N3.4]|uniref:response regulator transcription factor n=1 Tax=Paenibacillus sp. N3.4 TaxID=2603222 RepID=UPI0021C473A8